MAQVRLPAALLDAIHEGRSVSERRGYRAMVGLSIGEPPPPSSSSLVFSRIHSALEDLHRVTNGANAQFGRLLRHSSDLGSSSDPDLDRIHLLISVMRSQRSSLLLADCQCRQGRRGSARCDLMFAKSFLTACGVDLLVQCIRLVESAPVPADPVTRTTPSDVPGTGPVSPPPPPPPPPCDAPPGTRVIEELLDFLALAARANRSCSGQLTMPIAFERAPIDQFLVEVVSQVGGVRYVPHWITKAIAHKCFRQHRPDLIGVTLFCLSATDPDTVAPLIGLVLDGFRQNRSRRLLLHHCVWARWQAHVVLALKRLTTVLSDANALERVRSRARGQPDDAAAAAAAASTDLNLSLLLELILSVQYGLIVNDMAAGMTLTDELMRLIRVVKSVERWDGCACSLLRATIYQLSVRLAADLDRLQSALATVEHPFFRNLLQFTTVVDEFVFFSPLSYEEDSVAPAKRQAEVDKLKVEFATRAGASYLCADDTSDDDATPRVDRQKKPPLPITTIASAALVHRVLAELDDFDYGSVQRKIGVHIDLGNGYGQDLTMCHAVLDLLVKIRETILSQESCRSRNYSLSMVASDLRDEVRFFEHVAHFLDNLHIRNEKKTLSTTLSKRLASTGRNFKCFEVADRAQWDQYVQAQMEGLLLKEQRRSALLRRPQSLYTFTALCRPDPKGDLCELHLESENFTTHTFTVGDYRPTTLNSGDESQMNPTLLSRRTVSNLSSGGSSLVTQGNRFSSLSHFSEERSRIGQISQAQVSDPNQSLHNSADCLCRSLLWYKGRDIVMIQHVEHVATLYLVSQPTRLVAGDDAGPLSHVRRQKESIGLTALLDKYRYVVMGRQAESSTAPGVEYLFKSSRDRMQFALMCTEFQPNISVVQQLPSRRQIAPSSAERKKNATQCELCHKPFGLLFGKKTECVSCGAITCRNCHEKTEAIEMGYDWGVYVRTCLGCVEQAADASRKAWATRVRLESEVNFNFELEFEAHRELYHESLAAHAQSVDLIWEARPIQMPTSLEEVRSRRRTGDQLTDALGRPVQTKAATAKKELAAFLSDRARPLVSRFSHDDPANALTISPNAIQRLASRADSFCEHEPLATPTFASMKETRGGGSMTPRSGSSMSPHQLSSSSSRSMNSAEFLSKQSSSMTIEPDDYSGTKKGPLKFKARTIVKTNKSVN